MLGVGIYGTADSIFLNKKGVKRMISWHFHDLAKICGTFPLVTDQPA